MKKDTNKKLISSYKKSAEYLRYARTRKVALGILVLVTVFAFSCTFGAIGISSHYGLRTGGDTFKLDPAKGINVTYNNPIQNIKDYDDYKSEGTALEGEYIESKGIEEADFFIPTANVEELTEPTKILSLLGESDGLDVIERNTGLSWTQVELADIFSNPEFGGEKLIAPGTTGSYYFTVKNNSNFGMHCDLHFEDINVPESKVPMLYRFRSEDEYIMGNETEWLTLEEIVDITIPLNISRAKEYILDWKWIFEDPENLEERDKADTALGNEAARLAKEGKDLEYKIQLVINAEQAEFPDDPGSGSPITGETTAYIAAGGILAFTSGAAIIIFAKRRKKKKED